MSVLKAACPDCGKVRIVDYRDKTSRCVPCNKKWRKSNSLTDRQKRDQANGRRLDSKRVAIDYKGGKCIRCGACKLPECCFQFHHAGSYKKEAHLSHLLRSKFSPKIVKELDKCALLCANCHAVVHWAGDRILLYNVAKGKK